jgi:TRAP-type C4-dicarboxylate transport system permease small subunit
LVIDLLRINVAFAAVAVLAILIGCFSITSGIFVRNVLAQSTTWELEAAIYAIMYATFLGAAYTHDSGSQVAIDYLALKLPGRWRHAHRVLIDLLALGLFVVIGWSGTIVAWDAWISGELSDSLWGPPMWIPRAAIPLGSFLLALTLLVDIVLALAGRLPPSARATGLSH